MSVTLYCRPARRRGPEMPDGELSLQEPPVLAEAQPNAGGIWTFLPMGMMSMSMMFVFLRPGAGGVFMYVAVGMMATGLVAMLVGQAMQRRGERKSKMNGERRDYLRYLSQVRRRVRRTIVEQGEALAWRHPAPGALWSLARSSRLWERRVSDEDFAEVRIARGSQRLGLRLAPVTTRPVEDLEPLTAHALRCFVEAYAQIPDQPIAVYLRAWSRVLVRGEPEEARAFARAVLGQLATLHSPDDLWIALCVSDEVKEEWDWAKWLPHALHPQATDGAGPTRMAASAVGELTDLIGAEFAERPPFDPTASPTRDEPLVVVLIDGGSVSSGHRFDGAGFRNCVVIDLSEELRWRPGRTVLRLELTEGRVELVRTDSNRREQSTVLGVPDALGPNAARALAKELAPFRATTGGESAEPLASDIQLTGLLGINDLRRHELYHPLAAAQCPPAPAGADRAGRQRRSGGAGPEGVGAGRDGAARHAHRGDRLRQERAAAHPRARAGPDPFLGAAQLRPRRLQGRRDLPGARHPPPRLRRHHQPVRRGRPRGPYAGRPAR